MSLDLHHMNSCSDANLDSPLTWLLDCLLQTTVHILLILSMFKTSNLIWKRYKIATENAEKVMQRNKTGFDRHITASDLSVGDCVLVRNVRLRGKHKLADR